MRDAVQNAARDMVEGGIDDSYIDFNTPDDMISYVRVSSEFRIEQGNTDPVWVHGFHECGFEGLDLENLRLEFVRVYNRCLELDKLGAFDEPDEPAYDPIEAMRNYITCGDPE